MEGSADHKSSYRCPRCGKSTLFDIYQDELIKNGVCREQILAINFEDLDFEDLTDYKELYRYVKARLLPDKMNYIFLMRSSMCKDMKRL